MRLDLAALVIAVIGLIALPVLVGGFYVDLTTQILIFAIFAMTIDLLSGHTGRTPLGHAAIFGTATYVVGYMTAVQGLSLWLAIPAGIVAATVVAAICAVLALRATGVYFLLLTLAQGMIVFGIVFRWTSVTGAENGIRGIPRPPLIDGQTPFYYVTLAVFGLVILFLWRLYRSPFGSTLRGIRESATRMSMLGYFVPLHVFIAFTLSGFLAGIGGSLYALYNHFVSPTTVSLTTSTSGLLMVIIGGSGKLFGPAVGAAVITLLENYVSLYTDRWPTVLGILFVAAMLVARDGILGKLGRLGAFRIGGSGAARILRGSAR